MTIEIQDKKIDKIHTQWFTMLSNIIEIPKPFVKCYENALRECTCTSMNQTERSKWCLQVRGSVGEVTNWQPTADVWRLSNTKTWNKYTRPEWQNLHELKIYSHLFTTRAARDGYLDALREATRRDCNSKYFGFFTGCISHRFYALVQMFWIYLFY